MNGILSHCPVIDVQQRVDDLLHQECPITAHYRKGINLPYAKEDFAAKDLRLITLKEQYLKSL